MWKWIEESLEALIFNSRWLLAPFYLGLVASIIFLLVKFGQELFHIIPGLIEMSESDVIIAVLTLVDMALVGSLLLMIIFSGYEIFVSKIDVGDHEDKPDWMGKVDFSGLKLKLIGAIVAISGIELLKAFVKIPVNPSDADLKYLQWKMILHMAFVLSGVLFALMDRIAMGKNSNH